jgi:hypothetical protein
MHDAPASAHAKAFTEAATATMRPDDAASHLNVVRQAIHDIQNELQGMVGATVSIRSQGPLTPEQGQTLDQIGKAIREASRLVVTLSDWTYRPSQ